MSADPRRAAVLALSTLVGAVGPAAAAGGRPALVREYRQLVERYRDGDAAVVGELARWPVLDVVTTAETLDCRDHGLCRAAAVLQMEAAAEHYRAARREQAAAHLEAGRGIVSRVGQVDFAFSWQLSAGFLAQQAGFHGDAYGAYVEALRLRPGDPAALLARATAVEATALRDGFGGVFLDAAAVQTITGQASPAEARAASSRLVDERHDPYRLRRLGHRAEQYRKVLAADASLHEARLRLGRVRAALGQRVEARAELQLVLQQSQDPFLLALAHLCLARLADAPEQATLSYHAALDADESLSQAWLGLSEASFRMGDRAAAAAALGRAFVDSDDGPLSAWVVYHLGRGRAFQPALEALRKAVVEPR